MSDENTARAVLHKMPPEVCTVEDVRKYVEAIKAIMDDDETAHASEDMLRAAVLTAIANGNAVSAPELCAEALKTDDIQFARWCA
jgi:tellurite resistance protein